MPDFAFTPGQEAFRETLRRFALNELLPRYSQVIAVTGMSGHIGNRLLRFSRSRRLTSISRRGAGPQSAPPQE